MKLWTQAKFPLSRPLVATTVAILLLSSPFLGLSIFAHAEEAEEGSWVVSHQVEGILDLAADSSASQWEQAHHGTAHSLDEVEMEVMSVHNETYIVFLIERPFNLSISQAGAAVFINGTAFDSWNAVWGWAGGNENSTDERVKASARWAMKF